MEHNIILAYVLAASSFAVGQVGAWGVTDKWRGRETELAACHEISVSVR